MRFDGVILSRLSVLLSVGLFYLSSLFVKLGIDACPELTHWHFTFVRFLMGVIGMALLFPLYRRHFSFEKPGLLVGRGITNGIAVIAFFYSVQYLSVAEANLFNMTYPAFVAVFSVIIFRMPYRHSDFLITALSIAGIVLILIPIRFNASFSYLIGITSGISAAFSIIFLNKVRQYHHPMVVLFFMFFFGLLITVAFMWDQIRLFTLKELHYLFWSAFFGLTAQYFLTAGFKKISSLEGSIISSMRIILAAVVSHFFLSTEVMNVYDWIGAALIFSANILIAVASSGHRPSKSSDKVIV